MPVKYYLSFLFLWALGLFFGPGLILFGLWRFYIETRFRHWEQIPGVITKSSLRKKGVAYGGIAYEPHIEFAFTYHDVTAMKKAPLFCTGGLNHARALIHKYPDGANVIVFVNPKNPSQASLEMQPSPYNWLPIILGSFCLYLELRILLSK